MRLILGLLALLFGGSAQAQGLAVWPLDIGRAAQTPAALSLGVSATVDWNNSASGTIVLPTVSENDVVILAHMNVDQGQASPTPPPPPTITSVSITNPITAAAWAATGGGQATYTTTSKHGVAVGESFTVSGMTPAGYDGTFTAIAGTEFKTLIAALTPDPGAATVLGKLTSPTPLAQLTFARRGIVDLVYETSSEVWTSEGMEAWWAPASAFWADVAIEVGLSGSACNGHLHVYTVRGTRRPTAPFDPHPSMPATAVSATDPPTPDVTVSTVTENNFMAWSSGSAGIFGNYNDPAGWSTIETSSASASCTSVFGTGYEVFNSKLVSQSYQSSAGGIGAIVLNALTSDPAAGGGIIPFAPMTGFR